MLDIEEEKELAIEKALVSREISLIDVYKIKEQKELMISK